MLEHNSKNLTSTNYNESINLANSSNTIKAPPFNSDIEAIPKESSHYLCPKCHIFPFIEFCKDKRHIKFTCRCMNNKKILIKDLLDKKKEYIIIEDSMTNFLSSINRNLDCEGIKCTKHNKKNGIFL
jgi:hypothetical protein